MDKRLWSDPGERDRDFLQFEEQEREAMRRAAVELTAKVGEKETGRVALSRADIETIIRVADERADLVRHLRAAIEAGDRDLEHRLARAVAGLPAEADGIGAKPAGSGSRR